MIWVGVDLPTRYLTACALDDAGGVVAEHRRLAAVALSEMARVPVDVGDAYDVELVNYH